MVQGHTDCAVTKIRELCKKACSAKLAAKAHSPPGILATSSRTTPEAHGSTAQWGLLPSELLANIVVHAGRSASVANTLSQVCAGWRASLAAERSLWCRIEFRALSLRQPQAAGDVLLPWTAARAVEAGNAGAALLCARLYNDKKAWMRAARLGHPEAQWRVGWAYYNGFLGFPVDAEEAVVWLTRAARALAALPQDALSASADPASCAAALPTLMSPATCRSLLSQSAHILGLLHFDGYGCKQDCTAAMKWFRIAEDHGCQEAGPLIQSLHRSGQY